MDVTREAYGHMSNTQLHFLAWLEKKVKTHMLCTELPELPICFVAEKKTAGLNICPKNLFDRPS